MPASSPIDGLRAATETLASAAKTKTNAALFQDHLTQSQEQSAKSQSVSDKEKIERNRRKTEGGSADQAIDASGKSQSSAKSRHSHQRHASRAATTDQTGTSADQAAGDGTTAAVLVQADPLPAWPSSNGATSTTQPGTTADKNAAAETPLALEAAGTSSAATTQAVSQLPATGNEAAEVKAAAAATEAQAQTASSQTQPSSEGGKPFTFVRPASGPANTDAKATSAATSRAGQIDAAQGAFGSSAQAVKVVVQPSAQPSSSSASSSNAIAAQQNTATQTTTTSTAADAAQASPAQPPAVDTTANTDPPPAVGEQSLLGAAGVSASAETGQKHEFSGDSADKDDLSGTTSSSGATTQKSETNNSASTGFASLLTETAAPLQAAAAPSVPEASARSPLQVPAPPAEQVAFGLSRLSDGANSFSMQLDPERLGSVSVRLEVDAKGKARATFSAERPETLALMRQDSHHLLKALQDAGIKADPGSLNFSLKDQASTANQDRRPGANAGPSFRTNSGSNTPSASINSDTPPPALSSSRLYDLHA